jgi:Asp-tRNA(Asn)/Glu-tRNA(Gln) amidotransferase A subunit family amidase
MFDSPLLPKNQCFKIIQHVILVLFSNYPDIIYGKDTVFSVLGPMARSVNDLALWLKTICEERFHVQPDPYQRMVAFNIENFKNHSKKKLKIGFLKFHPIL